MLSCGKKIARFIIFLLCAAFLMPACAFADGGTRTVRVGYTDYQDFITKNERNSHSGYGVEYLNKIASVTGWEYEFVYDSWQSCLERLKSGDIDLLCNAPITNTADEGLLYSDHSSVVESSVLYVRADDERYYFNDFENFDGMTVAFLRDGYQREVFFEYAREHNFSYAPYYYDNISDCLNALECGVVDSAAVGTLCGYDSFRPICRFDTNSLYFVTSKRNFELIDELNGAVSELRISDPYFETKLYERYYGTGLAYNTLSFTREQAAYIENCGVVNVAVSETNEPLSFKDKDGSASGIVVDLFDEISERSGLKLNYVFLSENLTADDFLARDGVNIVASVASSELYSIGDGYVKSGTLFESEVVFVGRRNEDFDPDGNLVMAVPESVKSSQALFKAEFKNFDFIYLPDASSCFEAVRMGEADTTICDTYVARTLLDHPRYENMSIFPAYSFATNMVAYTLPKNSMLISVVDCVVNSITEDEFSRIMLANTVERSSDASASDILYKFRRPLVWILVLILVIIALLAVIFKRSRREYLMTERQNEQLSLAVSRADEANAAKSRFLSNMSHEIRTPLNAIAGLARISEDAIGDSEKVLDCLKKIESSSEILLSLVNDILDMSAIENNKLKIAAEPFNLVNLINSITDMYSAQCRQKGIYLKTDLSRLKTADVIGDPLRINQILLNLISNAYKFTENGGVTLTVSETSRHTSKVFVRMSVSDTGCGMSEDMLGRLFGVFEQESAEISQRYGGSGLGLSITKSIVQLMHGSIHVDSEKGRGTTFAVDIPLGVAEGSAEYGGMADRKLSDYDFSGVNILLAEDNALNSQIAVALLKRAHAGVKTVTDGKAAYDEFVSSPEGAYDVILMDIRMPIMNGYECTKAIRASSHPRAASIPVLAMTANAFADDIAEALSSGMNGHIAKPIDTRLLYSSIENALGR